MEFKKVESSSIDSYAYDDNTSDLYVKYLSGATYKYKNVSRMKYYNLMEALSKGSFINKEIKGNYEYEKV